MKKEVLVSAIIISYNQEKYIKKAIESVINQKVNFKYEIILADDCSPDNTYQILEEYKKKYPNLIKILKREKNMGATSNSFDACCNAVGKYITILEGDDYWCDENRLQIQANFLESHNDYIAVSHLQQAVDIEGNKIGIYPSWIKKDCDIDIQSFINGKNYSSSCAMIRNLYKNEKTKKELEKIKNFSKNVGDYQKCMYFLDFGKVHNIAKPMMVYRKINKKGESNYNSRFNYYQIAYEHFMLTKKIDKYFDYKYDMFPKYSTFFTLAFCYSLLHLNFKNIKIIKKEIPSKLKLKLYFNVPFMAIKLIYKKIRKL